MPYKEQKIEKLFYSIGEVAEMFGVNTSLIRYWEREFDIIKPQRNKKGNRLFTKKDVENFYIIYNLVKERKMTLDGAKKKLKENKEDTINNIEVLRSLESIKQMLIEVKEQL
ncbi:MAG: MerR family transcriptional regulator [Salinivirgaceae bacterium]|nr:MerR family transcriptional regulator [Salinivirgaceae bacterium]MBR5644909.1 MerR family transcriptional regulator [Salinivirgaceae bacterium]MBR5957305.1 MerR family transcriptional regulator [Salinivirgaceae bacterium]